ncbi:hypothetical protein [Alkalicoccobacillus porphyridii]|uniref:Uncharacterized protein n=1 Tax=Alkalicoccobacillus porphyridii TaxID=2597270 RepID=A0A554A165_9BACI|nr:hypothetical protein [Alkalicoccobacillus porphyridii]TSB47434.1 hypothetical protein FN960_06780 [Alkalicoccobacillus porphyridii]
MNQWIINVQWELFIAIEVLGFISLLLFGYIRYKLKKPNLSKGFIISFIALTVLEMILAWYVYSLTGEISAFQIIISLFVLYAVTFGVRDFKKLDRWMRKKIDEDNLITDADYREMAKQKDSRYQAKYYAISWVSHLLIFLGTQVLFFGLSGLSFEESMAYLSDLGWMGSESFEETPYANQAFHSTSMIWGIILVVDAIISATYVFQKKDKKGD